MSYRVLWISLTLIGSVSQAYGIKISAALGAGDGELARKRTMTCLKIIGSFLIMLSSIVLLYTRKLGSIFTEDKEFHDMFESVSMPFANMVIWMNLSKAFALIFGAMGRSDVVFYLGLIGSWVG